VTENLQDVVFDGEGEYHPAGSCDACAEPPDLDALKREPGEPLWKFSQRVDDEMKSRPCTCDPSPDGIHHWYCGLDGDEIQEAIRAATKDRRPADSTESQSGFPACRQRGATAALRSDGTEDFCPAHKPGSGGER
jgi:hypothetical protein